jgi:hypothetical protein
MYFILALDSLLSKVDAPLGWYDPLVDTISSFVPHHNIQFNCGKWGQNPVIDK